MRWSTRSNYLSFSFPPIITATEYVLFSAQVPFLSAAGGTVVNVLDDIVSRGADQSKITVVCVVACPPALQKLSEKFPGTAC